MLIIICSCFYPHPLSGYKVATDILERCCGDNLHEPVQFRLAYLGLFWGCLRSCRRGGGGGGGGGCCGGGGGGGCWRGEGGKGGQLRERGGGERWKARIGGGGRGDSVRGEGGDIGGCCRGERGGWGRRGRGESGGLRWRCLREGRDLKQHKYVKLPHTQAPNLVPPANTISKNHGLLATCVASQLMTIHSPPSPFL